MSRKLVSVRSIRKAVLFSIAFFALFASVGSAQTEPLHYFKNYFVTGNYVIGGVGVRGTGTSVASGGDGFSAPGAINISGVPADAEVVAAFLYWQTDEPSQDTLPSSVFGYFDTHLIMGASVGNANNVACDTASGGYYGRVYRADVRRFLSSTNGPHSVRLRDDGPAIGRHTNGASLVIVYRRLVTGQPFIEPFRAVVIYDGAFTLNDATGRLDQTIAGFYQADQTGAPYITSKMAQIVGNGQASFKETLNLTTSLNPGTFKNPYTGTAGTRWDNPNVDFYLPLNTASYSFHVTANPGVCLTWGAVITSTQVVDTDRDGLLDVWETNGLHLNPGSANQPATFGDCSVVDPDPVYGRCVNLPAMGANRTVQDIFLEIDWLQNTSSPGSPVIPPGGLPSGHTDNIVHYHRPKLPALTLVGDAFAAKGIRVHFDVGSNDYAGNAYHASGSPYIIPAIYSRGGEAIEENLLLCPNAVTTSASDCDFPDPINNYSVLNWKKGFRALRSGDQALGILPHFDRNRKDIFHYALFAHALAIPSDVPGVPKAVSGFADGGGGDLMVTLGLWPSDNPDENQTGGVQPQAGTLMHELGHNLALLHAGTSSLPNCKPNYPSVMNYLYQVRGLTDSTGEHINYSNGLLYPLNENSVSDTQPLGSTVSYRLRFYGNTIGTEQAATKHCDGTPTVSGEHVIRLESSGLSTPDWNRDGLLNVDSVDLNNSGLPVGDVFSDSNDWIGLNLQQIGMRRNVHGLSADISLTDLMGVQGDLGGVTPDLGGVTPDLGGVIPDLGGVIADLGGVIPDLGGVTPDLGGVQGDLGGVTPDLGGVIPDLGGVQGDLGGANELDNTTARSTPSATGSIPGQPSIVAINTINGITVKWLPNTSFDQVRRYELHRSTDGFASSDVLVKAIGNVSDVNPDPGLSPGPDGYINVPIGVTVPGPGQPYRSGCGVSDTSVCYNTPYQFYIISLNSVGASPRTYSNTTEITHIFVIANDLGSILYGAPIPSPSGNHIYGHVAGALTGVVCGFTGQPKNVGVYPITCSGGTLSPAGLQATDGINYNNAAYTDDTGTHTPGALRIVAAHLTVTADNKAVDYTGAAFTAFTSTITGFVNGDTGSVVSGSVAYSTAPSPAINAGPYTITPALGTLSASNYDFPAANFNTGTLTIRKVHLTVKANDKVTPYSGSAVTAFTSTITGFVNNENSSVISGSPAYSTSPSPAINAGPYTITPALGTLSAANYDFPAANFNTGTLTIQRVHLTVKADDKVTPYSGSAVTAFTSTITGFVNNENSSVINGSPAYSTSPSPAINVGFYTITPTMGTLSATNYDFPTFNTGTLQITKATTTTAITSDSPDPSVVQGPVTVTYTVTPQIGGAPTGNVTISDGAGTACVGSVAAGSCVLTFTTVGSKALTATYSGDGNFTGSVSAPAPHQVDYSVTLSPLKSPANLGSSVPVGFTVKDAKGNVFTNLGIVLKIESAFNGPVPATGCMASAGSSATRQLIYLNPNYSEGKSSLRITGGNDQFNWDTSSALVANGGFGGGCYSVLIYLNDRGVTVTNILSGPVVLN